MCFCKTIHQATQSKFTAETIEKLHSATSLTSLGQEINHMGLVRWNKSGEEEYEDCNQVLQLNLSITREWHRWNYPVFTNQKKYNNILLLHQNIWTIPFWHISTFGPFSARIIQKIYLPISQWPWTSKYFDAIQHFESDILQLQLWFHVWHSQTQFGVK